MSECAVSRRKMGAKHRLDSSFQFSGGVFRVRAPLHGGKWAQNTAWILISRFQAVFRARGRRFRAALNERRNGTNLLKLGVLSHLQKGRRSRAASNERENGTKSLKLGVLSHLQKGRRIMAALNERENGTNLRKPEVLSHLQKGRRFRAASNERGHGTKSLKLGVLSH